jgi:hypothetical protein
MYNGSSATAAAERCAHCAARRRRSSEDSNECIEAGRRSPQGSPAAERGFFVLEAMRQQKAAEAR